MQWISVKDKLPKNGDDILCFEINYGMFVAEYSRNDAIFNHPKFAYQVECVLGKKLADRKACLTLAAGLEYLYAQLCDYSGQIARDAGKKRITSDHLYQMIESDPEMKILAKKIRF
jgi:hypothetical protein